ncbi:MAG: ABC transporter ATP-binding protein [Elusimicrobia bacterium]|nr:ABC transporter ATP-binding protein [Elusimicrobiota bacterium]
MIKIKGLHLELPGRLRLDVDNLEIPAGILFALIGPNGAGKSTLLNILSLFQKPDKGSVEVFGKNILVLKNPLPYRRRVSFVLSRPYLLHDTVYNNISLPLALRGIRDKSRVAEMLALFKITPLSGQPALSLSQGETHRVALARALVTRPELILLDEPFSSLDPQYKSALLQDLRRIIKGNKVTTIFVTQDQNEALFLADLIGVIKGGRILQVANPQDVFARPISKEVADFIGIETIIEGTVVKKEDSLCLVAVDSVREQSLATKFSDSQGALDGNNQGLRLEVCSNRVNHTIMEVVSDCIVGQKVLVCVRPENITISTAPERDSARNHFQATIKNMVPWGLEYKIDLDCGFNVVAFVTKQSIDQLRLAVGQQVFAAFKATAAHLIKR